jgi:hypothetical protein
MHALHLPMSTRALKMIDIDFKRMERRQQQQV